MMLCSTPLLMVLGFLGLSLVVGLYSRQKETTFREYTVGNKRFHTNTLVVTTLATVFGGGALLRNMPHVYSLGISYIILLSGGSVTSYIISLLALRMGPFMEHLSIAETIGSVYGKYPRAIVALLGISVSTGMIAIEINAISSMIGICVDSIDSHIVTVLGTLIVTAYAMFGGIRAITTTDIMQYITFMIIIALLVKFLFIKTGKSFLEVIWLLQEQKKNQLSNFFKFDKKLLKLILSYLCYAIALNPSVMQRVYMSSGPIQAYKVFLRVRLCHIITLGCIVLMGWFVFVGAPNLSKTEIWPYILSGMSPAYKGYVIICILGLTMSTTDSNLHTAATMVGHDLMECIRGVKAGPYVHQLLLTKLAILATSILAMIVTVCYPNLFHLTKFVFTYFMMFFGATTIAPFILAVFGFRGSSRTALIGMATGILVHLAWEEWVKPEIRMSSGVIPLVANGLAMMVAHYVLPQPAGKGWIKRCDQYKRMQQLMRAFKKHKEHIDLE